MSNKFKKILSLDDLYNFYSTHKKSTHFSSKETGYQLSVHVPAQFEIDESLGDDTVLFAKARVFHIGVNRNKSNVTKEAAEKAMKTMAYKPVLAGFTDVNGELDFTSHDMEIDEENDKIIYLEKQIGCITADKPWFEEDEELGKTYVCAYVAIPREYTSAAEIIERKNGTKVSVELIINEMQFSAKDKCLELTDVIVQGLTALGTNPDNGEPVKEGMYGSKITLKDFSNSNNSRFSSISKEDKNKLIEMQNIIEDMVSRFDINNKTFGKEDVDQMDETMNVEEVMESEDIDVIETEEITEIDEVSDVIEVETETEVSTEEVTETAENESEESVETPDVVETEECNNEKCEEEVVDKETENVDVFNETNDDNEADETIEVEGCKKKKCEENEVEDDVDEVVETDGCKKKEHEEEKFSKTFELSHEDIRCALYCLLDMYNEEFNDWYYIVSVYDDFFIFQGYNGDFHGQKYIKNEDDTVVFDGRPYDLFADFLTTEEKAALETMRSNYSSIQSELNSYKDAEIFADKMTVFSDPAYSAYLNTSEFKSLMNEETINKFSKEELFEKADAALGKVVKATKTFAVETKEEVKKPSFFAFAKQEKSSFLDGLLNK